MAHAAGTLHRPSSSWVYGMEFKGKKESSLGSLSEVIVIAGKVEAESDLNITGYAIVVIGQILLPKTATLTLTASHGVFNAGDIQTGPLKYHVTHHSDIHDHLDEDAVAKLNALGVTVLKRGDGNGYTFFPPGPNPHTDL